MADAGAKPCSFGEAADSDLSSGPISKETRPLNKMQIRSYKNLKLA